MVERKVPTKEEWEQIIETLSGLLGNVELRVDGYEVTISRRRTSQNRIESVVFVNGELKGEWAAHHRESEKKPDIPEVTRRFFRKSTRQICSAKEQKAAVKNLGKRLAKKWGYMDRYCSYTPIWPSAKSLKRHLLANNHNIELIKVTRL